MENAGDKMIKEIEMDIKDIEIVRDSIGQIEQIGTKYNVSVNVLFEKVNSLEKVKV